MGFLTVWVIATFVCLFHLNPAAFSLDNPNIQSKHLFEPYHYHASYLLRVLLKIPNILTNKLCFSNSRLSPTIII